MAHNPQAPQGSQEPDPAGSTQMFRAFVDEEAPQRRGGQPAPAGPKVGMMVGVALGIVVLAVVAWLAFG